MVKVINEPAPEKLPKALQPQSEGPEISETQPIVTSTAWRTQLMPAIWDALTAFTKSFIKTNLLLQQSKPEVPDAAGYLLDKYVPLELAGDSKEWKAITVLGAFALNLFKAIKEDLEHGNTQTQAEGFSGFSEYDFGSSSQKPEHTIEHDTKPDTTENKK